MTGRPKSLPGAERYVHGTRSRYVCGCRCAACKESNRVAYHERQRAELAAALEVPRRADGMCAGAGAGPCPSGRKLRKDVAGGVCARCRRELVDKSLVSARRARAHLRALSAAGVGYKSVAAAADVSKTVLRMVLSGERRQIRHDAERRILAVTADAVADSAPVDARATWRLLEDLLARGFTRTRLARELGQRGPGLQVGRERVLARTELAVRRMHARLVAEREREQAEHARGREERRLEVRAALEGRTLEAAAEILEMSKAELLELLRDED